eukprot:993558-Rhodomonas_salina.1
MPNPKQPRTSTLVLSSSTSFSFTASTVEQRNGSKLTPSVRPPLSHHSESMVLTLASAEKCEMAINRRGLRGLRPSFVLYSCIVVLQKQVDQRGAASFVVPRTQLWQQCLYPPNDEL